MNDVPQLFAGNRRTRLPRLTLCPLAVACVSIIVLLAGSQILPTGDVQAAESQLPAGEEKPNPLAAKQSRGTDTQQDQNNQRDPLEPVASYGDARFRYGRGKPMDGNSRLSHVLLTMLQKMEVNAQSCIDSLGPVSEIL